MQMRFVLVRVRWLCSTVFHADKVSYPPRPCSVDVPSPTSSSTGMMWARLMKPLVGCTLSSCTSIVAVKLTYNRASAADDSIPRQRDHPSTGQDYRSH